jgi:Clostripain family
MEIEAGERLVFSVYLAGDNNLSEEMVWSLQEMKAASSEPSVRERVRCSALFDPQGGAPRRYDFGLPHDSSYSSRASEDIGSLAVQAPLRPPTEDPVKLLTGLVGGMPKGRPVLVLSGHGSGAVGDFLNDEKPASALSIPLLGRILKGKSIEILGLDSCQMSTVEVGYEVRKSVSYLVASEGPISNTGWPYRQILTSAAAHASASPGEIARALAESYLRFYRDYEIAGVSTDVAVSDLSRIELVARAVSGLASALADPLAKLAADGMEEAIELGEMEGNGASESRAVRDAIVLAHWSAQSYKCDRYSDLHDFARQLLRFSAAKSGSVWDSIRDASELVLETVEAAVLTAGTTGPELQHSHGLSIYFPWSFRDYIPEYRNLRFAEETGWRKFLEIYLGATRRMRRFQASNLKDGNSPADPRRIPDAQAELEGTKDVEAGTRKDVEAGTRKGLMALLSKSCRSTMKNPADGHYPPPGKE